MRWLAFVKSKAGNPHSAVAPSPAAYGQLQWLQNEDPLELARLLTVSPSEINHTMIKRSSNLDCKEAVGRNCINAGSRHRTKALFGRGYGCDSPCSKSSVQGTLLGGSSSMILPRQRTRAAWLEKVSWERGAQYFNFSFFSGAFWFRRAL